MVSSSRWAKVEIWLRRLAVLLGGKNHARKAFMSSSHVEIDPGGSELSHALALSLNENGNKHKRIAYVEAPFIFNVSQTSNKIDRCKFASSIEDPPNCDC